MFRGKKVIIFDMDGTLIDSVGIWNEIDLKLINLLKTVEIDEMSAEAIQERRDRVLRENRSAQNPYGEYCKVLNKIYCFNKPIEEIIAVRYEIAQDYLQNAIDYKTNADIFIKTLNQQGYILAIASTTKRSNMNVYQNSNKNIINKAAINKYFSIVYTREDVAEIKPDPEVYFKVMETLHVTPKECLVFEDSLVGVEAAKKAGIEVVLLYDKYSDADRFKLNELADYKFDDYKEVLSLLREN